MRQMSSIAPGSSFKRNMQVAATQILQQKLWSFSLLLQCSEVLKNGSSKNLHSCRTSKVCFLSPLTIDFVLQDPAAVDVAEDLFHLLQNDSGPSAC